MSPVSDRQWFWYNAVLAIACIGAGIILALHVIHDKEARHAHRMRDKCVDTVMATNGAQADIEKCFTPR